MNHVSHKKGSGLETNLDQVYPLPILLVKEKSTGKSYGGYVKLKLSRYLTHGTSDLYEIRMSLFDHSYSEEFQMTIAVTGTIETKVTVQYLCTLFRGEALRQFDLVPSDAKNIEIL